MKYENKELPTGEEKLTTPTIGKTLEDIYQDALDSGLEGLITPAQAEIMNLTSTEYIKHIMSLTSLGRCDKSKGPITDDKSPL